MTIATVRTFALASCFVLFVAAPACSVEPPLESTEEAIGAASIVGKYRFVWEGSRKEAVYRELAAKLSGSALEAAKREADEEAAASHIELGADGKFRSFIGDQEIGGFDYGVEPIDERTVRVTKPNGEGVLVRLQEDGIVIEDPRKGPLTFRRSE